MTSRVHSSPYCPAAAASPPACSGVTVSARNGSSSIAAVPAASRPAATCSAVSSSPACDAIFFQNGASDSAAARAPSRSPASMRVRSSDCAPAVPPVQRVAVVAHVALVFGLVGREVHARGGGTHLGVGDVQRDRLTARAVRAGPPAEGDLVVDQVVELVVIVVAAPVPGGAVVVLLVVLILVVVVVVVVPRILI